ncbi:MAG TPA: DUF4139 domain-containing protein [Nannocystaceae bacterium]|nr:DUF4139 domain-containing protein [Nannocystaceae bacterium]
MNTLPIRKVLVMEDRAQIERAGEVALGDGVTTVVIEGVAIVAVDRSLEVSVEGAALLDARLRRRWREKPKGGVAADASAAKKLVRALELELVEHTDASTRVQTEIDALVVARADVLRAIAEAAGAGQLDVAAQLAALEELGQRQSRADERQRAATEAYERCVERLREARTAVAISETREHDFECALVLSLSGSGVANVRARYQVPCAVWRPAYRARLGGDAVELDADAVVWQATGEAWNDVELALSTARPTLGTTPPQLYEDRLSTRAKQEREKKSIEVGIREVAIEKTSVEGGGAAEMPGLDDGGEARVLTARGRATIPDDGQPHRVSIASFGAPVKTELVCTPEQGPEAVVLARFTNTSGQVLLAGPVDLLRSSGYVGRSSLAFAAMGETVELSFGSEDGVVVLRDEEVEHDTSRLTGKNTHVHTITLHVSNASAVSRTLVLQERIPVSEVKEVQVEVQTKQCDPAPREVDKDGIAKLELTLPAGATKTAKFVWELEAAGKVAGLT